MAVLRDWKLKNTDSSQKIKTPDWCIVFFFFVFLIIMNRLKGDKLKSDLTRPCGGKHTKSGMACVNGYNGHNNNKMNRTRLVEFS